DPAWAAPNLDDSHWLRVSKGVPLRKYGFPDAEAYWYRFHLRLPPNARNLALYFQTGGANVAVYANGRLIGQNGSVTPGSPLEGGERLPPVAIPNPLIAAAHGNLTLAFHVYTGSLGKVLPGLFDYKTTQVTLTTPEAAKTSASYDLAHQYLPSLGVAGLQTIVGLCALFLFLALRSQREYLALTVWMFAAAAGATLNLWTSIHNVTYFSAVYWLDLGVEAASTVAMIEFVRLITRTRKTRWLLGLEIVVVAVQFVIPFALSGQFPLNLSLAAYFVPIVVSDIVLPILLLRSALRGSLDARLILVPFVLWAIVDFYSMIGTFTFTLAHKFLPDLPSLHVYSYSIGLGSLFDVLGLLCLLLIILTRTTRLARERASLASEIQAAEQVQTLLLARASRPTPGYRVETVYRPMSEVGGDFFLVSPDSSDGSLLVILGDVSGKGMGAAMRVSLILGVLNREQQRQPKSILIELNEALRSQGEIGFTTACCVRLERDGRFTFSNAGHLNPYVNGQELSSPGT
ncbi:MAG: PP2C family protein-serine/threonine phosphatase, partial [Nitrososphaerales archaeon]